MPSFDPGLLDFVMPEHAGYPDELAAEDTADALRCAAADAAREFPAHLWVEPADWPDAAADNDRYQTWPLNYIDRYTNQNPTHECTTHGFRAAFEACRNRLRGLRVGPPVVNAIPDLSRISGSVWISCLSLYAEANPRQRGGASTRGVLEIACRRGALPDLKQPRDWKFAHALTGTCGKGNACQSHGSWVPLSRFPEGWEQTARWFRPLEIIFPESWEQIVSLVLRGYVVVGGRAGHCIPYAKWLPADNAMAYVDSYDLIRYDSPRMLRRAATSAYAIASTTLPDDWNNPAPVHRAAAPLGASPAIALAL